VGLQILYHQVPLEGEGEGERQVLEGVGVLKPGLWVGVEAGV